MAWYGVLFEDVLDEPVARNTAAAAATAMSPTTAINRRQLIWIPLRS
jgi:mannose-1-phosphate guanylyltransferase